MKRLPVLQTVARAANRGLIRATFGAGPIGSIASRAAGAISSVREGFASLRWPSRPESINLELTAICDARCIHCPRHDMDRSQRPMNFQLFKRIIDQAAELRVPTITPNGFGEVLTMRNLADYIAYIRSKTHRFHILVNTNGQRLDEEKRRLFLDHEVDLLNITLDGATPETFDKIRDQLSLTQIEENIHAFLEERRRRGAALPKLRIGIIVIPQNEHEVAQVLEKWRNVADYVGAGGFTNRAGSLDEKFGGHGGQSEPARACVLPFQDLNIWADGRAVLCCDDWNEEHRVGDLNVSSLEEVWHGEILRHARKLHSEGRGQELDICSRCNLWRPPAPGTRLWV
jgi:MoaA/NifB/PqqE/SkfB family radical SAM enzyme